MTAGGAGGGGGKELNYDEVDDPVFFMLIASFKHSSGVRAIESYQLYSICGRLYKWRRKCAAARFWPIRKDHGGWILGTWGHLNILQSQVRYFKDKGYAFVRFDNKESACNAIVALHLTEVLRLF